MEMRWINELPKNVSINFLTFPFLYECSSLNFKFNCNLIHRILIYTPIVTTRLINRINIVLAYSFRSNGLLLKTTHLNEYILKYAYSQFTRTVRYLNNYH